MPHSKNWTGENVDEALHDLLGVFQSWLGESFKKNKQIAWSGVHDEGTYMTAWREYFLHTNDATVVEYAHDMLAKSDAWISANLAD